jgi:hypothetical protein
LCWARLLAMTPTWVEGMTFSSLSSLETSAMMLSD